MFNVEKVYLLNADFVEKLPEKILETIWNEMRKHNMTLFHPKGKIDLCTFKGYFIDLLEKTIKEK